MSPHDSKFLFKLKLLVPLVVYCTLHDKKRLARCLNLRFEQTVEVQADSHTKGNVEPFSRAIETCFFLVMALSRNAGTTGTTVIKTSNSFIELVIVRPAAMLTLRLIHAGVDTKRAKFHKLFNDRDQIGSNRGYSTSFSRNKKVYRKFL